MSQDPKRFSLYVLRLRNGNCVVTFALDEEGATTNARALGVNSEVASVRALPLFTAQFVLGDEGQLKAMMLDPATRAELLEHEYPMLKAAEEHSFADFGRDSHTTDATANLYSRDRISHEAAWPERDKKIIHYAVEQERLRFSN